MDIMNSEPLGHITSQLAGIIKLDRDVNYKELLTDALMEKYLKNSLIPVYTPKDFNK